MTDKATDGPDHGKLIRQFEESYDSTQDARELAERDRDYYDGKQLTDAELETYRQRKQPPVVSNRIKPKIDALLGFAKKKQMQPKAYPRTPKHEKDADSVTDAVRFACDQARFDIVRMDAAENLFIEGEMAATVTVEMRGKVPDVKITHVPWDRFYHDPHSRRRDFADAAYMGVVLWLDEDEALALGKNAQAVIDACYEPDVGEGQTYDDRPKVAWADKKRKRVRVLQHRWREGGRWMTAIVCKGGFIRPPQVSPYLNEHGDPECDLIAGSAYIDRDNNRYGDVRQMISPQDEINKRRSKALHLLNSKQVIADMGAVVDVEQARAELAKPDGYVEKMPDAHFEIVDAPGLVAGQFQLLQEAKAEIDASGVDPALSADTQAPSGRAQEMLTQMGLAEKEVTFSALQDWSWRIYRATWNRIRQYWTDERWIRVTDNARNLRWVGINRPVTMAEMAAEQQLPPDAPPEAKQQLVQQLQADPVMQRVVKIENAFSELDVDIILEEGPDSVTVQAEQYQQLIELKKADPAAIPTEAIIEASQLRNKDKLLEHIQSGGIPPQVQQQMQDMQQALQDCQKQLQDAQAKLQDKGLDSQKAEADRQLAWYEAETARLAVLQKNVQASAQLDQAAASELMQHISSELDRMHQAQMAHLQAALTPPAPPADNSQGQ